jgi:hypothetical protein
MTLKSANVIEYKEVELAALYRWVHRCFDYSGSPSTLEADIRRALTVNIQNFSIIQREGQRPKFVVAQKARNPKAK